MIDTVNQLFSMIGQLFYEKRKICFEQGGNYTCFFPPSMFDFKKIKQRIFDPRNETEKKKLMIYKMFLVKLSNNFY